MVPLCPAAHRWVASSASIDLRSAVPTVCAAQVDPLKKSMVPDCPTAQTWLASVPLTAASDFVTLEVCETHDVPFQNRMIACEPPPPVVLPTAQAWVASR